MRRKSGANFDELLNKEWSILTKNEYSELQTAFKRTDQRNGGISFYDMINIIRSKAPTIQTWAFPSPRRGRTRSTRISSIRRFASSISPSCSTLRLPSRRRRRRTTAGRCLRRMSIVLDD
jgi:hypothetical protein